MLGRNAYLCSFGRTHIFASIFAATGLFLSIGFYVAAKPADLPAINTAAEGLSFAERVSNQRSIENVYWRHRIWPNENPGPKPLFDAAISQAQLETKVTDYLLKS